MLTGDKTITAISIAKSSDLINKQKILYLTQEEVKPENVFSTIESHLKEVKNSLDT